MKSIFLDAAQAELESTVDYYEQQRSGLGLEFAEEVEQALQRIEYFPEAWSPLSARVRRCLVHRFPFGVIYEIQIDLLVVVAIQNLRQEPDSWRSRIE